ncbi:MAG: 50S ribosomal protein L17 [Acidobacteria bacterium]|nr:50S ribosomal protein L17 [Acidobacteriota bacterium]
MRHRVAHRKLGRTSEHRMALLRNQSTMLLRHERIDTTLAKAKELRPFVERLITVAKRGLADGVDTTKALHARRLVARDLADKKVVSKLFDTIAPRFADRPGGYARVLRLGRRQGDQAEIAQIELVGSEYDPAADRDTESKTAEAAPTAGVGGRLRAAAKRLAGGGGSGRGSKDKKKDAPGDASGAE